MAKSKKTKKTTKADLISEIRKLGEKADSRSSKADLERQLEELQLEAGTENPLGVGESSTQSKGKGIAKETLAAIRGYVDDPNDLESESPLRRAMMEMVNESRQQHTRGGVMFGNSAAADHEDNFERTVHESTRLARRVAELDAKLDTMMADLESTRAKLDSTAARVDSIAARVDSTAAKLVMLSDAIEHNATTLDKDTKAIRMRFFETFLRDLGHRQPTKGQLSNILAGDALAHEGHSELDRLLFMSKSRADESEYELVYGVSFDLYQRVWRGHLFRTIEFSTIVSGYGTLRASNTPEVPSSHFQTAYDELLAKLHYAYVEEDEEDEEQWMIEHKTMKAFSDSEVIARRVMKLLDKDLATMRRAVSDRLRRQGNTSR